MRALSLHHLIATEISAVDLVRIAGALDCRHVCLFTQDPGGGFGFPIVADPDLPELRRSMNGEGVTALGIASFALTPQVDLDAYRPALARGAALGATCANVRPLDPDSARATDNFGRFATIAQELGIRVGIEFSGFGASDALARARAMIAQAGIGGIALDALHAVRTATPLAELIALAPDEISYVQLCDGPLEATAADYAREGAFDRQAPGEGQFPLEAMLALTRPDLPLSLEVPTATLRDAGVDARTRCAAIVAATRRLLDRVQG
ncbi:MAG: TIM barrel protein [Sphingobium sp.]